MLLRAEPADPEGVVAITQPAHGWVAGQLARAWGDLTPEPLPVPEEVYLATEQHDGSWAAWEGAPTLDRRTGRPHTFLTVTLEERLAMWTGAAARLMLPQSRYAAVLVSLHATRLHAAADLSGLPDRLVQAFRDFLRGEERFREGLLEGLRADPRYATSATPGGVERAYGLLSACDRFSLALCPGVRAVRVLERMPTPGGAGALTLTPLGNGPDLIGVSPWPFRRPEVSLVWEGRRLRGRFAGEEEVRAALDVAPWVTYEAILRPAGAS
jgi:hypothetical protein